VKGSFPGENQSGTIPQLSAARIAFNCGHELGRAQHCVYGVILALAQTIRSGIHPEAPESWRRGMTFTTPASVDNAYAATLIDAAVNRRWLAHY